MQFTSKSSMNLFDNNMCSICCGQLWVRHMFCGRDLWWTIPLHIFHWSCWDTFWIPKDHMDLSQIPCVQVPVVSRYRDHVVNLDQSQSSLRNIRLPVPTYGSTWVVIWLLFCRSAPPTLINSPLFRVRFRESLVVRLYSEIDHLHLSSEAQCVSNLLPLGDCHTI